MRSPLGWLRSVFVSAATIALSAPFWYVLLSVSGVCATSLGVAVQFGAGYGLMAFGVLSLIGSELIRRGLARV